MQNVIINLMLCFSILISGCALTNNSFYQTGETLQKGKVRAGLGISSGTLIMQPNLLFTDSELSHGQSDSLNSLNPINNISKLTTAPEIYFGYGLTNRIELNAKGWIGANASGGKIGSTIRLSPVRSRHYNLAISPQYSYTGNSDSSKLPFSSMYIFPNYSLTGFELPFINSYAFNRSFSIYWIPNYTFYKLKIDKWVLSDLNRSYDIHRLGIALGLSLKGRAVFFRPEISFGFFKGKSSNWYSNSTLGIGFGLEMPNY